MIKLVLFARDLNRKSFIYRRAVALHEEVTALFWVEGISLVKRAYFGYV